MHYFRGKFHPVPTFLKFCWLPAGKLDVRLASFAVQAGLDSGGSRYVRLLGSRVGILAVQDQLAVGSAQGRRDPDPAAHALANGCPAQVDSLRFQGPECRLDFRELPVGPQDGFAVPVLRDLFVDFGPTRAKAEGRAPYLWDLFSDALDDEDKPVGWELSEIGKEVEA